jgi:putative hemolysin
MVALEIIVVATRILANGYLAMCELAIVSSRRARLERLAEGGHCGARAALKSLTTLAASWRLSRSS